MPNKPLHSDGLQSHVFQDVSDTRKKNILDG
jgi:hypothetical protein